MKQAYSVLMSVYQKENPEYLRAAVESVLGQTVPPEEVVLVCDGPLTEVLDRVIAEYEELFPENSEEIMNLRESDFQENGLSENDQHGDTCQKGKIQEKNPQESQRQENSNQKVIFRVVRLPENGGLGKALNEGLKHCSCEWIARMDTDDLSAPDRCEKQLKFLEKHPEVDALSGTIAEFQGDALDGKTAETAVISYKTVPETQKEIAAYIKQRNPINHPCAMFRKSRVESAGGYQPCPYFEDYDLWVRMYKNHAVFANLSDTLLYMRINGMHQRRGGIRYAKCVIDFRVKMYRNQVITFGEFLPMTIIRVLVSLMPNSLRRFLYEKKLRKQQ